MPPSTPAVSARDVTVFVFARLNPNLSVTGSSSTRPSVLPLGASLSMRSATRVWPAPVSRSSGSRSARTSDCSRNSGVIAALVCDTVSGTSMPHADGRNRSRRAVAFTARSPVVR